MIFQVCCVYSTNGIFKGKIWEDLLELKSGVPVLADRIKAFLPDGCADLIDAALIADGKLFIGSIRIRVAAGCGAGTGRIAGGAESQHAVPIAGFLACG